MEGVIVLTNNKPLLSTRFAHPRLADLAVDAYLNAKRNKASQSLSIGVPSPLSSSSAIGNNGKGRDLSLDPVIWFEVFEDFTKSRHASTSSHAGTGNGSSTGKRSNRGRARQNSYTMSDSDEDEESDEAESSDEEDDDDNVEVNTASAWASTSSATHTNGYSGQSYGCCHISHNNLTLLVPIRRDCDISIPFSYLYSLLGVLRQYIGSELNDVTLRDNFDVALQLLEETFNAPYPLSTDASALQELVPTSNLFSKMLMAGIAAASQATSSVSGGGSSSGIGSAGYSTPSGLFSSPLYWRREGIRYPQNEVYFDVNEEIRAILDKDGHVLTGDVWGRIDCRSKLSGMPDISLALSRSDAIEDPSFHPCVRIGKWTTSKQLSFVPPDGEFELMGYRLSSNSTGSIHRRANARGQSTDTLPLRIRPVITTGEVGGSFTITLAPSGNIGPGGVVILEDVVVQICLGSSATAVKGSIQSNDHARMAGFSSSGSIVSQASKAPIGGTWEFDTASRYLIWKIPKLLSSPVFSGTWQYEDNLGASSPSPVLGVEFKAPFSNISGLSITSLKMAGEKYSMYKGLRSNLKGGIEVRW